MTDKTIYLIRHGTTSLNAQKRLRGWENPPLNEEGIEDAKSVAKFMRVVKLDRLYVSDLIRATQTADEILDLQGKQAKLKITKDLRPIDWGIYNGELLSKVQSKMEKMYLEWQTKPNKKAPGGESWNQFQDRQLAVWKQILYSDEKTIAIVAHLRNCIYGQSYALTNGKPIQGESLDLLYRVTQVKGLVSIISYKEKEGFQIVASNTDDPLEEGDQLS